MYDMCEVLQHLGLLSGRLPTLLGLFITLLAVDRVLPTMRT